MPHTNGTESDSTPVEFTLDRAASIVAAAIPDREMIVQGDRRFTFAQVDERARRFLARALELDGVARFRELRGVVEQVVEHPPEERGIGEQHG